jgi:hypothetical protein
MPIPLCVWNTAKYCSCHKFLWFHCGALIPRMGHRLISGQRKARYIYINKKILLKKIETILRKETILLHSTSGWQQSLALYTIPRHIF